MQNRIEDGSGCITYERLPASGHLVEHGPERKKIRARVQFLAVDLLRGQVGNRADSGTRPRQVRLFRADGRSLGGGNCCHELEASKVKKLGLAASSDKKFRRLNVPMNYALCMSSVERIGDLIAQVDDFFGVERLACGLVL